MAGGAPRSDTVTESAPLPVTYFSDVLCIWAYAAEARVEEIRRRFGSRVGIENRFCSVFGDTASRIGRGWADKGGYEGFNSHLREVAARFDHIELHPELWLRVRPASSESAHLFLKAVGLCEPEESTAAATWQLRLSFFRDCRDIAQREVQLEVAEVLGLAIAPIERVIASGQAFAVLCADTEAKERFRIEGSPTFLLNEGRQKLYGNVGYRVIESNIQELLRAPDQTLASWC